MAEYEYVKKRFCPSGANNQVPETVEIPDAAIGVTLSTWGDPESTHDDTAFVTAKYLVPEDHDDV